MKLQFFTNTPAHVHLYRNAIQQFSQDDYKINVLARDYGCTIELLEYYDIDYNLYGECNTNKLSLFRELPVHYFNIIRTVRMFDPDLIFGIGSYAAHAGAITQTPVVNIFDSEPTEIDQLISRPFTNVLLTPSSFERNLGDKHYLFEGFKETAYLHPNQVQSSSEYIHESLQIESDQPYVLVRFNAFGSHHDVGKSGFSMSEKKQLIELLSEYAVVFISDEGGDIDYNEIQGRKFDLHPGKMHKALEHAELLVADTQTMVTEAALLGTPAIRSNSFVGESDMGNFKDLEKNNLIYNEREFSDVLDRAVHILEDDSSKNRWRKHRDEYLKEKIDLTQLIIDIITEFDETDLTIQQIVRDNGDIF